MKKFLIVILATILSLCTLTACTSGNTGDGTIPEIPSGGNGDGTIPEIPSGSNNGGSVGGNATVPNVPQELTEIPQSYYTAATEQGTLVELNYTTYESMSYAQKTTTLNKRAIVYLPYGYSDEVKYNVFYLMHGGWGNETTSLGTPERPSGFKNVIDNAIANGDFAPLIIVCPTYNNTSSQDSANFSLALQLNRNYHNELLNDLMPAAESKYSTFAEDTTPEGLAQSRTHRGFGGFSMGSVATWRTFQNCLPYFYYFLPMSCGTSLDDDNIWSAAEGFSQSDYFVMMAVGTDDFSYSYDNSRAARMRSSKYFTEQTETTQGNFVYRIKEGYTHGGGASTEYTYNGLMNFWKNDKAAAKSDYTADTRISDVINDEVFGDWGRIIFSVNSGYYSGTTLGNLSLTWYSHINVAHTVEICNYFKDQTLQGNQVFYDIYTDAEKAADSRKADTGLFFFRGNKNAKFAVTCAGGGWAYVGAMHDSFPHAIELSKKGYNAFAIIYRPGAQTAYEDLARAISFIFAHATSLASIPTVIQFGVVARAEE